jgi:hypothetical protein
MKEITIQDIRPGLIRGVHVQLPNTAPPYREAWFAWTASTLSAHFETSDISGGVLNAWKHLPRFEALEYHIDREFFFFCSGIAIMPFAQLSDAAIDPESIIIARIPAGTQLVIDPDTAHFVPVAEDDVPITAIISAPRMDAPRIPLHEPILGVTR